METGVTTTAVRACATAMFVLFCASAYAEHWIPYYQIGGGRMPGTQWDTYVVDGDSIQHSGELIKYRTRVLGDDSSTTEMQANCSKRTRGQPPDASLYATYEGTLGGAEVKMACKLALQAKPFDAGAMDSTAPPDQQTPSPRLMTAENVRHFCDGVMGSIGAGNLSGTVKQLNEYLLAPASRLKKLDDDLGIWYRTTIVQYGDAQGFEFVGQNEIPGTLIRSVYVAKYQRGATRWIFLFYKRENGWALLDVRTDANLFAVFPE